ncbi:MAG: TIGR03808 family TAT-translocated repetitive protein, partial [Phyllobacteriaceae bacterium]|nr:TIGR03808 family TAT-translocated repetitive protein [Phyllobacteriaceae bacterium]
NFVNFTPYEPERVPVGIYAEADIAVTGNVVENCPGIAYLLGWGPYLRNVALCGNVAVKSRIGIGVSIAEGAGTADISANRIDASQHQIAGMRWHDVAEPDLAAVQENYPQITIR